MQFFVVYPVGRACLYQIMSKELYSNNIILGVAVLIIAFWISILPLRFDSIFFQIFPALPSVPPGRGVLLNL